ncbi:hypothetical protein KM043_011731 [Ampulex compressa]|nr:hypothetical protein KM043_011731 [Ampulex compressa]
MITRRTGDEALIPGSADFQAPSVSRFETYLEKRAKREAGCKVREYLDGVEERSVVLHRESTNHARSLRRGEESRVKVLRGCSLARLPEEFTDDRAEG